MRKVIKSLFMRKILSIASVLCSVAASSYAGETSLKLNGYVDSMFGHRQQKDAFNKVVTVEGTTYTSSEALTHGLVNEAKVDIKLDNKTDAGVKYGAFIRLNGETSTSTTGKSGNGDKVLLYWQNDKIGRFELGSFPGAGGVFELHKGSLLKGLYGIEGHWAAWASQNANIDFTDDTNATLQGVLTALGQGQSFYLASSLAGYRFLLKPSLPSNYSTKHYSDANKVTFYTQPADNLTVGISYIPDLDHSGTINVLPTKANGAVDTDRSGDRSTYMNIFSGGFKYEPKVRGYNTHFYGAGEVGEAKDYKSTNLINHMQAYEVGAYADRDGYSVGFSYGDWGKTGTYKVPFANTKQGTKYWTAIFSHELNKHFDYSLSYMHSKKAGGIEFAGGQLQNKFMGNISRNTAYTDASYNTLDVISLGIEYKFVLGAVTYLENTYFKFDSEKEPVNNKGNIFLTGVRMSF